MEACSGCCVSSGVAVSVLRSCGVPGDLLCAVEEFIFLDLTALLGKQLAEPGWGLGNKFSSRRAV